MLITSVHNEHIKELVKLKEKKYRDETGTFLVETKHLVLEAYKAGLIKELILEKLLRSKAYKYSDVIKINERRRKAFLGLALF